MRILLNEAPSGYVHTVIRELPDGGFSTWVETRFRMARMGTVLVIATEQTQLESASGTISKMSHRTFLSSESAATAVVVGDRLHISQEEPSGAREYDVKWDATVRGLEFGRRGLTQWVADAAVGDEFPLQTFEMELGQVAVSTYRVQSVAGDVLTLRTSLDVMPGMVETVLMSRSGTVSSREMTLMGMTFLTEAASKQAALDAMTSDGVAAEVFATTVLRPNHPLPRPRSLDRVLFRLKAKDTAIPFPAFDSERQRVMDKAAGEVLLEIRRVEAGEQATARVSADADAGAAGSPALPSGGDLAANGTIQSDDPAILALGQEFVGDAVTDWDKARRLERGVFEYIDKKSFGVAFATASEVCRNRSGDCSEHAVLLAALGRSQGIPSRIAMGLTYVGGIFGGHAWTEMWMGGRWVALDGTNGLGSVDAAHIRFGVSALSGLGMGAEMYSSLLGLANLEIEVVETEVDGTVTSYEAGESHPFDISGKTLTSNSYVFRVDAPAGFSWSEESPHWMSGRLARAVNDKGDSLTIYARAVSYEFGAEDLAKTDERGLITVKRTVKGRSAVLADRSPWTLRVLDRDTVFRFDISVADDDLALQLLSEVADSVSFDAALISHD